MSTRLFIIRRIFSVFKEREVYMKIDMESIGERIKNRRKQLHLTQTDIKNACGISSGSLSEIENGNRTPSVVIFHALAQVLECSMDWLATGESPDAKSDKFSVSRDCVSDGEYALLDAYRQLDLDDQDEIMDILNMKLNRAKRKKNQSARSSSSEGSKGDILVG